MASEKLKIGVLLDDMQVPAWVYELLNRINSSDYASIELIALNSGITSYPGNTSWNNAMYFLYKRFENKFFKKLPDAFESKKINFLDRVKTIEIKPEQTKFVDRFSTEDVQLVKDAQLDVLLRFGFRILKGDILSASKQGIWSYHHGDNKVNRGMPAGVWEVFHQSIDTGTIVQKLSEDLDAGDVLYRSYAKTDALSFRRNKNNYYWKSSAFIPRLLKRLHTLGDEQFWKHVQKKQSVLDIYHDRLYTLPNNAETFKALVSNFSNAVWRVLKARFYMTQWILLYKMDKSPQPGKASFYQFQKMLPPKNTFWADPFIYQKDDVYYIFIEEFIYAEKRGVISYIKMEPDGTYTQPKRILDKPYHLSYPFLFEQTGKLYMIPETAQNKTIELYECTSFPDKWEFKMNLMENVEAVDATIFKYEDKYWMFTNMREHPGTSKFDELFLFYSETFPTNDWKAHPLNPVVSDVKKARPAGNIFQKDGQFIRPSQNCSKHYGYGMNFSRIVKLSETEYEEHVVHKVFPNWDAKIIGTHTFNQQDRLTIIDAIYERRK